MALSFHSRLVGVVGIGLLGAPLGLYAEEPVRLWEAFPPGYQYHVSTRTDLSGSLSVAAAMDHPTPKALPVTGTSSIEYDERVLTQETNGQVQRTARIYRRIDFQRQVGEAPQQTTIRPGVRRLVVLRHQQMEVPFSPDGPLTWGEIDLVRTDVFTPALVGLLPDKPVRPGERWIAAGLAIQELTDLERIEEGQVECRFEGVAVLDRRRHARVSLAGAVRGVNEDGPNRQELEGYFYFDLETNHLSYLYLKGTSSLQNKDGKTLGRIEGKFVLTRQAPQTSPDLSDEALKGVALEPTAANTLLLYDNPDLGVRFLHPRRWRVAGVRGRQVALDETNGSGLLLTLEPLSQAPTAGQFHAEVNQWLQRQKGRVLRMDQPRRLSGTTHELDHFAIDVELMGQRVTLDYYAIRQKTGAATLAARLLPKDLAGLQNELDGIVRSLTITKTIAADGKK